MFRSKDDKKSGKPDKKHTIALAHLNDLPPDCPATPAERGFIECPCAKDCSLHGSCLLCAAYHGRKGREPRCCR